MTHLDQSHENASIAAQKAADALDKARVAQRSAADSMVRSAASQLRIARMYDGDAEQRPDRGSEYREHAAVHRRFAHDDREMAQALRDVVGNDAVAAGRLDPRSEE